MSQDEKMNAATEHPSFWVLDRLALGAEAREAARTHVDDCEHCQSYMASCRPEATIPTWVREVKKRQSRRRTSWLWAGGMASALAAAVVVIMIGVFKPTPIEPRSSGGYIASKGAAAVGVYIKRGARVMLWDRSAAVRPGDTLRLKLIPAGFSYVDVFTTKGSKRRRSDATVSPDTLVRLHSSEIDSKKETVLARAWRVDDQPGPETLIIALSTTPTSAAEALRVLAMKETPLASGLWVRWLSIPKEVRK